MNERQKAQREMCKKAFEHWKHTQISYQKGSWNEHVECMEEEKEAEEEEKNNQMKNRKQWKMVSANNARIVSGEN